MVDGLWFDMGCLTNTLYTMQADVMHAVNAPGEDSGGGSWVQNQDPISGELIETWVPDNPDTTETETADTIPCEARPVVGGGIRMSGSTESFGENYVNTDIIKMKVPKWVKISSRDRITNVRDARTQEIIWKDEEYESGTRATVFNISGVIPSITPLVGHVENILLLEKAEGGAE